MQKNTMKKALILSLTIFLLPMVFFSDSNAIASRDRFVVSKTRNANGSSRAEAEHSTREFTLSGLRADCIGSKPGCKLVDYSFENVECTQNEVTKSWKCYATAKGYCECEDEKPTVRSEDSSVSNPPERTPAYSSTEPPKRNLPPVPPANFSGSDARAFAEARIAFEKYNDCSGAQKALNEMSAESQKQPSWVLFTALCQECLGLPDKALQFYVQYDSLMPNQPKIIEKIGELRYKTRKATEEKVAAEAERKRREAAVEAESKRGDAEKAEKLKKLESIDPDVRRKAESASLYLEHRSYGFIHSFALSPDGKSVALGIRSSQDAQIVLFSVASGNELKTLEYRRGAWIERGELIALAYSPDGQTIVSNGGDDWDEYGHIYFWDVSSGRMRKKIKAHEGILKYIAFSPTGKMLASVDGKGTVKIWSSQSADLLKSFNNTEKINEVAFSPDGEILATASEDTTIKLWDTSNGRFLCLLEGHKKGVSSVAFSHDGKYLASASSDNTIKVWDVSSRKLLRTIETPDAYEVKFSPDGKMLASAGGLKICLWDTRSGLLVRKLEGGGRGLAFSPDGRLLVSVESYYAKLWRLQSDN